MNNFVHLHLHTMLSNPTTILDSVNSYKEYIAKAKEYNMTAICFTEHGNVMSWYNKMLECKKNNIKYIHGCEAYVTKSLKEKVRDNYHCVLIAKNTEGLFEINYLLSDKVAFNNDGHMYYNPRITYDELKSTSDNIIILTACLGGILNSDDNELKDDFIEYMYKNRHKCYLEIQPHMDSKKDQSRYNKFLLDIHNKYNIPMVATNDVHYLDEEYKYARSLLQQRKNIHFENEDEWCLDFKDYNNILNCFLKQGALPKNIILQALNNTGKISDIVEDYTIDNSIKYPKLYKNPKEIFDKKIKEGIEKRNIDINKYRTRLKHEYETINSNGSIDYMLLEEDVKKHCRENGIKYGASRGSSSGSVIAYLLNITDVDSLKYDLNFERFMSKERVSLCDIDSDYEPSKRHLVKKYLHEKKGLYCAEIITFNTIKEKGALKDIGGALKIPFNIMNDITKNIDDEDKIAKYTKEYPELFKYAKLLEGVVVSVGVHPAGTLVSPIPLDSFTSTFRSKTCEYPITQLNMKEVDKLNFVKLDILGLETIEIINDTCKMANIDFLTPQNFNPEDENIYKEIHRSSVGIFQWESPTAFEYYKQLFSKETILNIKSNNTNFKYLDLLSIGNGAIRPAGESYRDELAQGTYKDNGIEVINEYFKSTLGNCVFQESIMGFLNKFCGFTMGEADLVRRGFAKKTGTEEFIPKIRQGFLENSGLSKEEGKIAIDTFIKVVEDASDYLFSLNHSLVYSIIGAMCGYLRHYHTLEFITVCSEHSKDDQNKTNEIMNFIKKHTDFKVENIKFGKSESKYVCDKTTNTIYKGMNSVKYINNAIPNELNNLYGEKDFYKLTELIKFETSTNSRQLETLIKIDYFKDFAKIGKLLKFVELYKKMDKQNFSKEKTDDLILEIIKPYSEEKPKTYVLKDKDNALKDLWNKISDQDLDIITQLQNELELLGYLQSEIPKGQYVFDVKWSGKSKAGNKGAWLISRRNSKEGWFKFKKGLTLPSKDSIIITDDIKGKESYTIHNYSIMKEA